MRLIPSVLESPKVLRVRTVEIVDGAGNIRLRVGVDTDGAPSLRLYYGAGIRRLEVAVPADGPGVTEFERPSVFEALLILPIGWSAESVIRQQFA